MSGSTVAANIRAHLAARDEKQQVLADLLGITDSSVSRRLRGETPFRDFEVNQIATHFGVSVASLFSPKPPKSTGRRKAAQRPTQRQKAGAG